MSCTGRDAGRAEILLSSLLRMDAESIVAE